MEAQITQKGECAAEDRTAAGSSPALGMILVIAAVIIAAVVEWAVIRISPLFIVGIFIPPYLIGYGCALEEVEEVVKEVES